MASLATTSGNRRLSVPELPGSENKTRDRIIVEHLPQIRKIAQRIASRLPHDIELDDLVSVGIFGLINAIERFDASRGVQFKTYAELRIRGAILDSLREMDWAPRSLRQRGRRLEVARAGISQRNGASASDEQLADEMDMTMQELHRLQDQLNSVTIEKFESPEQPVGEETSRKRDPAGMRTRHTEDCPFEATCRQEMRRILADLVDSLPERERLVVSLYYFEELTMKEVGQILSVNESRISQLHSRAMMRLRHEMRTRRLSSVA